MKSAPNIFFQFFFHLTLTNLFSFQLKNLLVGRELFFNKPNILIPVSTNLYPSPYFSLFFSLRRLCFSRRASIRRFSSSSFLGSVFARISDKGGTAKNQFSILVFKATSSWSTGIKKLHLMSIAKFYSSEKQVKKSLKLSTVFLNHYWKDLIWILRILLYFFYLVIVL